MYLRRRTHNHDEAAIRCAREGGHGAFDFASVAQVDWGLAPRPTTEPRQCMAHCPIPAGPASRSTPTRSKFRCYLFEHLKPFAAQTVFELSKAGCISARSRQTLDKARHQPDRGLGRTRHGGTVRLASSNAGIVAADAPAQRPGRARLVLPHPSAQARGIASAPTGLDAYVAADGPPRFLQPLRKCYDPGLRFRLVRSRMHEHAHKPYPLRVSCARAAIGHVATAPPTSVMELVAFSFDHLVGAGEQCRWNFEVERPSQS